MSRGWPVWAWHERRGPAPASPERARLHTRRSCLVMNCLLLRLVCQPSRPYGSICKQPRVDNPPRSLALDMPRPREDIRPESARVPQPGRLRHDAMHCSSHLPSELTRQLDPTAASVSATAPALNSLDLCACPT